MSSKRGPSPSPRRTPRASEEAAPTPPPRSSPGPKRPTPAGAKEDGSPGPSPGPKPKSGSKKPASAKPAKAKAAAEADLPPATPVVPDEELDRIRVFMRVVAGSGSQTSTCVGHDFRSAWSLDFEGQRTGSATPLDGVYGVNSTEYDLYGEVVDALVADFVRAPRGVATLMTYGPAEAGKSAIMYGESGNVTNFTPRGLPAPHHQKAQRDQGLVLRTFGMVLTQLSEMSRGGDGAAAAAAAAAQAGQLQMACVMLHVELFKDLLSPQSKVRLSESESEGVQLHGVHWQSIADVKEAEGLLQLATQNKAVHTLQADNGFLDACHIVTALRLPTGALPDSGLPRHKLLYLVELAAPPPARPSGVGGLNVEDFCALNASLRGLQASIGVMARKGSSRPPLRDAKLTRLLSASLGADAVRTHLLLLASCAREHAETSAEMISFGGLAMHARLRPNVYDPTAPRALCSQLQADLATIELPGDEARTEMLDQMTPRPAQLEKLAQASNGLHSKLAAAETLLKGCRSSFDAKLQQLSQLQDDAQRLEDQAAAESTALRSQVMAVAAGRDVGAAVEALRASDAREIAAISKQVEALQARLSSAKMEKERLQEGATGGAAGSPAALLKTVGDLIAKGKDLHARGELDDAHPILKAALATAEVAKGPMAREIVPALSALADLQVARRREEEAIGLLKRAYTVDKDALGPDAAEVGQHLIGLGSAYHQQGKLEAASLTLEEARSILVFALGPDHERVQQVAARIKKLSVIEVDTGVMAAPGTMTPRSGVKSAAQRKMEERLSRKKYKDKDQLKMEMEQRNTEAELRRGGLLSARGNKAGDAFIHAAEVAERATSEKEKRATGERRELLQKKKAIFRERLAQRNAERAARPSNPDDSDDVGSEEEGDDSEAAMAATEAEMTKVFGEALSKSQQEDWGKVVECATAFEELMNKCRNKSNASGVALRVFRSGVKTVGANEERARSALAVLMMIEWCVQQCDSSFRHALGGERWVRRLVELARKDETEQHLVRATVMQLLVNWSAWYEGSAQGSGFEAGVAMLRREGYALPEPTRMQDGTETPRGMPDSAAGKPVLLGQVVNNAGAPSAAPKAERLSDAMLTAEMAVMREDLDELKKALASRKAGDLTAVELAEARQACNDCTGWLARLGQLLGSNVGGGQSTARGTSAAQAEASMRDVSEKTKGELRDLQKEMAEVHRTFQAAYPGGKPGLAPGGTPRNNSTTGGGGSARGGAGQANGLLELGQTPRTKALFMGGGGGGGGGLSSLFLGGGGDGSPSKGQKRGRDTNRDNGSLPSERRGRDVAEKEGPGRLRLVRPSGDSNDGDRSSPSPEPQDGSGTARGAAVPKLSTLHPAVPKLKIGGEPESVDTATMKGAGAPKLSLRLPLGATGVGGGPSQSARAGGGGMPPGIGALDLGGLSQLPPGSPLEDVKTDDTEDVASAQLFLQEVAILQMQAEGWKAEWSISMQENERLRMALYDAQAALEALPPNADGTPAAAAPAPANEGELQWRELCTSIARGADEEKAMLLEELNNVRAEIERQRMLGAQSETEMQQAQMVLNKERAHAEHWRGQLQREQEELTRVQELLRQVEGSVEQIQLTARGSEKGGAAHIRQRHELMTAIKKRNDAESALLAKQREEEAKLTAAYNENKQALDKLEFEHRAKRQERDDISQSMGRWRTKWEEEMYSKNAVAAELLTLRSEFEKSSATYDKEIEALKEQVERTRNEAAQAREKWDESVGRKNQLEVEGLEVVKELEKASKKRDIEQKALSRGGEKLLEAQAQLDKWKTQAEEAEAQQRGAARQLEALRSEHGASAEQHSAEAAQLTRELAAARAEAEMAEQQVGLAADLQKEVATLQAEHDSVEAELQTQRETLEKEKAELERLHKEAIAGQGKHGEEAESARKEKEVLGDELASLKAEVEELTVSHDLEVERLQERLGQLQTVQDKLELTLREKKAEHEKAWNDADALEESKLDKLKEQREIAQHNLKESSQMLRDATAALKRETKLKKDANDVTAEQVKELAELLAESKETEAKLVKELTEEGVAKERLDANLAAERVREEEALATLKAQLGEAKGSLKEAEAKATKFAKEYGKEFYLRKEIGEKLQELTGGLRVFCRIRPPKPDESEESMAVTALDDTTVLLSDKNDARRPTRRFEFNQVYGPAVDTAKLFSDVRPMISQTLEGFNVCVLMYGATGSGKTHTLEGSKTGDQNEPGLLQSAVSAIFDQVAGAGEAAQHEVFLSVLEIVDEKVVDLQLAAGAPQPSFEIARDETYGMVVRGLSTTAVHTASHVRSLLGGASEKRATASASHLVCTLSVRTVNVETGDSAVGKLTMVELAGSELASKGESANASLAALHALVAARTSTKASKGAAQAAVDSSLLTTLLQDSLTGNSKTMMLVTVAPVQSAAPTAGPCLEFGVKARSVSLGPASKNKESMQTAMNKVNTTMSALAEHASGGQTRRGPKPKK